MAFFGGGAEAEGFIPLAGGADGWVATTVRRTLRPPGRGCAI